MRRREARGSIGGAKCASVCCGTALVLALGGLGGLGRGGGEALEGGAGQRVLVELVEALGLGGNLGLLLHVLVGDVSDRSSDDEQGNNSSSPVSSRGTLHQGDGRVHKGDGVGHASSHVVEVGTDEQMVVAGLKRGIGHELELKRVLSTRVHNGVVSQTSEVLVENVGVGSIVDGAINRSNVVVLLSEVDEACVRVDEGAGGESFGAVIREKSRVRVLVGKVLVL